MSILLELLEDGSVLHGPGPQRLDLVARAAGWVRERGREKKVELEKGCKR